VKTFGLLIFIGVLFIIGASCLFFPDRIQAIAIRSVGWGLSSKIEALNNFVRSKNYLINVRAVGTLSLLCSIFLLWMLIKNW
jgi:hypothetical protein